MLSPDVRWWCGGKVERLKGCVWPKYSCTNVSLEMWVLHLHFGWFTVKLWFWFDTALRQSFSWILLLAVLVCSKSTTQNTLKEMSVFFFYNFSDQTTSPCMSYLSLLYYTIKYQIKAQNLVQLFYRAWLYDKNLILCLFKQHGLPKGVSCQTNFETK